MSDPVEEEPMSHILNLTEVYVPHNILSRFSSLNSTLNTFSDQTELFRTNDFFFLHDICEPTV